MKFALGLEYKGTRFHGWQRQPNKLTLQGCLEHALSLVADHPVTTVCAGRTDRGVHAFNQVVHFETTAIRPLQAWIKGVNTRLPLDIRVLWARQVSEAFSARFSAQSRRYHYYIFNHAICPAIYHDLYTWIYYPLNEAWMQEAANYLIGEYDFTSFRSSECQSLSPHRCIQHLIVQRSGSLITIDIKANAFLHHMVRNIAGALLEVGNGKQNPSWIDEILKAKNRRLASQTAPAQGLYLYEVTYPKWR